jgi:hypothetical protein
MLRRGSKQRKIGQAPANADALNLNVELYQDQDGRWRRSAQRFAAKIALRKCR